jgi:glutamate/tyrosine decarboxylase-like PLP-dependent enzyme
MFARSVSLHLKPNRVEEFTRIIEKEVIPMMRSLRGFQDKIVLVASGGLEANSLSIWDLKEDAEAYGRGTYRDVVKALAMVVEGTPRVETREVSNSTFHKIPARLAA